jgi:hypothetical protein
LDELEGKLDDNFTYFCYLRIQTGDELSKRLKFIFIQYVGKNIKQVERILLTVYDGAV